MKEELASIERNETWEPAWLPKGKKPIDLKWVFRIKKNPDGTIAKYKARLVARGFLQKEGVDYDEVFAPVARLETVRIITAVASFNSWPMYQLDVKSAFLNGFLEEEVYVTPPPGFSTSEDGRKVYKLKKALYGLKQAPRAWNKRIDNFLQKIDFVKSKVEYGVYTLTKGDNVVIICLYVDDLLITGSNEKLIQEVKKKMMQEFEMTDLGRMSYFLGLEFRDTEAGLILHQKKYATEMLKRFNMLNCNAAVTPMETGLKLVSNSEEKQVNPTLFKQIVGSLRYLCNSRPDISFAVGMISRFMSDPRLSHLLAAKRVLRYIRGTLEFGLLFPKKHDQQKVELVGFSESDWSGDAEDRRSTAGYLFKFLGVPISWSSKKQSVVAQSSCEAEYIAAASAACQAAWIRFLLKDLKVKLNSTVKLQVDNKYAINLASNPIAHGRTKHIETKFHYIRDQVEKKKIELQYCSTEQQAGDVLTKALGGHKFKMMRELLGVINMDNLN
uniref:Copia protein n=1 Tax=Cajanus cajan TaxID=3821 RepID=A0A151THW7_CAJCA|nr:Copia protein [Cajanus cajan]